MKVKDPVMNAQKVNIAQALVFQSQLGTVMKVSFVLVALCMHSHTMVKQVEFAPRVTTALMVWNTIVEEVTISQMLVTLIVRTALQASIAMIPMAQSSLSLALTNITAQSTLKIQLFVQMEPMHPVLWSVLKLRLSVHLAQLVSTVLMVLLIRQRDVMLVTIVTHVPQSQIWKRICVLPVITVNVVLCFLNHALMDTTHSRVLEKKKIAKFVSLVIIALDKLT